MPFLVSVLSLKQEPGFGRRLLSIMTSQKVNFQQQKQILLCNMIRLRFWGLFCRVLHTVGWETSKLSNITSFNEKSFYYFRNLSLKGIMNCNFWQNQIITNQLYIILPFWPHCMTIFSGNGVKYQYYTNIFIKSCLKPIIQEILPW